MIKDSNEGKISVEQYDPEPVHGWFGLSYSNYQVLHRTLMQSMPVEWQQRMVACLQELSDSFGHVEQAPCYIVEPAREVEYGDLSRAEAKQLDVTYSINDPDRMYGPEVCWDRDGREHEMWERTLVPTGADPVPHYDRGRTRIEPAERPQ